MRYLLFFCIFLSLPLQAGAESSSLFDDPETGKVAQEVPVILQQANVPRRRMRRFRGYNKYYRDQFAEICGYLKQDGRSEAMHKILEEGRDRSVEEGCQSCVEFFRAFSRPCAPLPVLMSTARKEDEEDEEESPGPIRYREPDTKAVDLISRLFIELAGDEAVNTETFQSLDELLKLMKRQEDKTRAEHDYLGILAAYMQAPFRNFKLDGEEQEIDDLLAEDPANEPGPESLFDY